MNEDRCRETSLRYLDEKYGKVFGHLRSQTTSTSVNAMVMKLLNRTLEDCHLDIHRSIETTTSNYVDPNGPSSLRITSNETDDKAVTRKEDLKCPECPFIAKNFRNKRKHIKLHSRPVPGKFRCNHCSYSTDGSNITNHERLHGLSIVCPKPKFNCPLCPHMICTMQYLAKHLKLHDRVPPGKYQCRKCSYSVDTLIHLGKHMKVHGIDSEDLKCPECPFIANDFQRKENHLKMHNRVVRGKFQCNHCSYSTDGTNITNHERLHGGSMVLPKPKRSFKCLLCPDVRCTKYDLAKHLKLHDRVPPGKYQCRECSYSVDTLIHLGKHMKVHGVSKFLPTSKFNCPLCPDVICTKRRLAKHLKLHDRVPAGKYQCRECSYSVDTLIPLGKHMKVHGVLKCPECPFIAKKSRSKENHMKLHNRAVPGKFQCNHCSYSTDGNNITSHERLHEKQLTKTVVLEAAIKTEPSTEEASQARSSLKERNTVDSSLKKEKIDVVPLEKTTTKTRLVNETDENIKPEV